MIKIILTWPWSVKVTKCFNFALDTHVGFLRAACASRVANLWPEKQLGGKLNFQSFSFCVRNRFIWDTVNQVNTVYNNLWICKQLSIYSKVAPRKVGKCQYFKSCIAAAQNRNNSLYCLIIKKETLIPNIKIKLLHWFRKSLKIIIGDKTNIDASFQLH